LEDVIRTRVELWSLVEELEVSDEPAFSRNHARLMNFLK